MMSSAPRGEPACTSSTPARTGIFGTADDIVTDDVVTDDVASGNQSNPTLGVRTAAPAFPNLAQSLFINNVTPDNGLSAPSNSWFTFFGQFFDHGLDMIDKGGNGTVFIQLAADDPLYDKGKDGIAGTADDGWGADGRRGTADDRPNFMLLTRATDLPGPDGMLGTADDIHQGPRRSSTRARPTLLTRPIRCSCEIT